jgi:uncharacterized LabA/DUF88 family protein
MAKKRVIAYIDGYNLYHGIVDLTKDPFGKPNSKLNYLKWLDLQSLIRAFTLKEKEDLVKIYYFSAYATWKPEALLRHRAYVAALKSTGVTVVMGTFKAKKIMCSNCKIQYVKHEEKETDVNIALKLLHDAMDDSFDRAIIVTGDSDLKPAIREVKEYNPCLTLTALIPGSRFFASEDLKSVCDSASRFGIKHIEKSLFPETIMTSEGKIIKRPEKFKP